MPKLRKIEDLEDLETKENSKTPIIEICNEVLQ